MIKCACSEKCMNTMDITAEKIGKIQVALLGSYIFLNAHTASELIRELIEIFPEIKEVNRPLCKTHPIKERERKLCIRNR